MRKEKKLLGALLLLLLLGGCNQSEDNWLGNEAGLPAPEANVATSALNSNPRMCISPARIYLNSLEAGTPRDFQFTARNISGMKQCFTAYQQLILVNPCYGIDQFPEMSIIEPLPEDLCLEADQTATTTLKLTAQASFDPPPTCETVLIMRVWFVDLAVDPYHLEYHDVVISFDENPPVTPQTIGKPEQLMTYLTKALASGAITTRNSGQLKALENQIKQAQKFFELGAYEDMLLKINWIEARCDGEDNPPDMIEGAGLVEFQNLVASLKKALACL